MDPANDHDADPPHDVLAAEAFAVGMGDAKLHREPARDVLAADQFPLPAAQPHAVPPEWQMAAGRADWPPRPTTRASKAPTRGMAILAILAGALVFRTVRRMRRRDPD